MEPQKPWWSDQEGSEPPLQQQTQPVMKAYAVEFGTGRRVPIVGGAPRPAGGTHTQRPRPKGG